jgi:alanine racemase
MLESSHIQISRSALETNLRFLQQQMGPAVRISSVVKGNAYGHGIECFVPLAEACGIRHFSVSDAHEAYRVKAVVQQPNTEIMIMGMIEDEHLEWAVENGIAFFTFETQRLEQALAAAQKSGRPAKVHLEVETGMNRTGFCPQDLPRVAQLLRQGQSQGLLRFEGLCTHFAGAESIGNYLRVREQRKAYNRMLKWFRDEGLQPGCLHTACSAAAMRYPPTRLDMVRIGILQYGFWPSREVFIEYNSRFEDKHDPLQRLISWKSQVMDVKKVRGGQYIGYGTSYLANTDMEIAIIPVGYAHGFSRSLSNQGRVLIHGKRVGVVGTVNMNAITVDISRLDGVSKGDEVVFIGYQGDMELTVSSFAEFSEQVNYEMLTRLPTDIPRQVVE